MLLAQSDTEVEIKVEVETEVSTKSETMAKITKSVDSAIMELSQVSS